MYLVHLEVAHFATATVECLDHRVYHGHGAAQAERDFLEQQRRFLLSLDPKQSVLLLVVPTSRLAQEYAAIKLILCLQVFFNKCANQNGSSNRPTTAVNDTVHFRSRSSIKSVADAEPSVLFAVVAPQ